MTTNFGAGNDDDVIEISPRAFAETTRSYIPRRYRNLPNMEVHSAALNLAVSSQTFTGLLMAEMMQASLPPLPPSPPPSPPPPPPPAILTCPICLNQLVALIATKCGHVFCNTCLRDSLEVEKKCPICREKSFPRDLRPLYGLDLSGTQ